MPWERGAHVAVRSRPEGAVGYTFPAIVVCDTRELMALYQPSGSVCKRRNGERGGPNGRNMVSWDGSYADVTVTTSTLHVWTPDDPYWVIRTWSGSRYDGWYINLADPWRRTPIGIDTLDRILDVVVSPDRSSWRWKDEDELTWSVEQGRYTAEQAETFVRDGLEAIERMRSDRLPFNLEPFDLDPDPAWSLPALADGWDRV